MSLVETITEGVTLHLGDCRDVIWNLQKRPDVIITDPPYGVTDHDWDVVVPADAWMVSPSICFAAEPYASWLIADAPQPFKYDLVWAKNTASNLENCAIRPARSHERVLVFGSPTYTPQKRRRTPDELARLNLEQRKTMEWSNPGSVLYFDSVNNRSGERTAHPSQKPTDLLEWLVLSYSEPEQTILDPFMGSGSTGVAAVKQGRRFVGVEANPEFFDLAARRISEAARQGDMFTSQSSRQKD